MSHVHAREHLSAGATVRVDCDHQCNVMVMDDHNYAQYRRGRGGFNYHGGFYQRLPAGIRVPHSGYWNTVIDLGGRQARIRHSIHYIG
jgi:hypothetical protein